MRGAALGCLLVLGACTEHPVSAVTGTRTGWFTQRFGPDADRRVDALFVVDSSGSMREEQHALGVAFPAFARALDGLEADWRVAVTTTDLGAAGHALPGCADGGDGGLLRPVPGREHDPWLWREGGATNAPGGDVEGAFAAMARVGTGGCGFEMPLGAAARALDAPGWRRDDALLAVVIVTDEDDCTVRDPAVLDPANEALGPPTDLRCFAAGVACDVGPDDPLATGPRDGCRPSGDGLEDPLAFAAALAGRAPGRSLLAVVAGPPSPVVVGVTTAGERDLLPSCSSRFGRAAPAIRLGAAVGAAGQEGLFASLCDGDLAPVLDAVGDRIGRVLGHRCLADRPAEPIDCVVLVDGQPTSSWHLEETPDCPSGLSLALDAPTASTIDLTCAR